LDLARLLSVLVMLTRDLFDRSKAVLSVAANHTERMRGTTRSRRLSPW